MREPRGIGGALHPHDELPVAHLQPQFLSTQCTVLVIAETGAHVSVLDKRIQLLYGRIPQKVAFLCVHARACVAECARARVYVCVFVWVCCGCVCMCVCVCVCARARSHLATGWALAVTEKEEMRMSHLEEAASNGPVVVVGS
jgi:hypothetical protein